jgi:hypothetical protein
MGYNTSPINGALTDLLPIHHSFEDLDRVVDVWSERYFSQPNYWRINGKPWVSFFCYHLSLNNLKALKKALA